MKLLIKAFLVLTCIVIIATKGKSTKKSRKSHKSQDPQLYPVQTSAQFTQGANPPQNIAETFYGGNPNTLPASNHFLWKDFKKNQFQTPYMHGVVGPTWRVPVPEEASPYTHISSPVPHSKYDNRIIPHDLLPRTHSATSWDMPKRKDVVQIDLPNGSTHTREMYADPRFPPKKLVSQVTGTQYHNTGSVDSKVNFANNMEPTGANHQTNNSEFSFIESKKKTKKHKKKNLKGDRLDDSAIKQTKEKAISEALEAENRGRRLLYTMSNHPEGNNGSYALGIDLLNNRDNQFVLHQNNAALENSIESLKRFPQGIRSMHTKPFIPKPVRLMEKKIDN
jgi:hypothetical protein